MEVHNTWHKKSTGDESSGTLQKAMIALIVLGLVITFMTCWVKYVIRSTKKRPDNGLPGMDGREGCLNHGDHCEHKSPGRGL